MNTKLQRRFQEKVMRVCATHQLIVANDHVVVGISGGIDSMVLLHALAQSRKFLPFNFQVSAVHIHPEDIPIQQDLERLKKFVMRLDVSYNEFPITTKQIDGRTKKGPCFRCSWARRKRLFAYMNECGANKLAFGHHMDDAIETLLMNMVWQGEISSMPYHMKMRKGNFSIIRPLLTLRREEIEEYANLAEITPIEGKCPNEQANRRDYFRNLISELQVHNSAARVNLFRSMSKIFPEHMPK